MLFQFSRRTALLLLWDIAATFLSYLIASLLTKLYVEIFATHEIYFVIGIAVVVNLLSFVLFRLYNNLWEYASLDDALRIVIAVGLATLVTAVVLWMIGHWVPIRIYFVSMLIMIFFVGGSRVIFRLVRSKRHEFGRSRQNVERPRTLIVGAGETGSLAISRMSNKDPNMPGEPIVAVDDNPAKQGLRIHGIRVMGSSDDIEELVDKYDIEQIVVAIPSASIEQRKHIYNMCVQTDCQLRTLPIKIVDLPLEEDVDAMLRSSRSDRRVTLDLDEGVLHTGEGTAEKALPFPVGLFFRERLRLGIPALFRFLNKQGYDIWLYSAKYYSFTRLRRLFRLYRTQVTGIVTGTARKSPLNTRLKEKLEKGVSEQYRTTVHIDATGVLRVDSQTRRYEEYPLKKTGPQWSAEIMDLIGALDKNGQ